MVTIAWIVLLIQCGPSPPEPKSDILRIGMRRPPDSLNPYISTTIEGDIIHRRLFPSLFRETPQMINGSPKLLPVLVNHHQWDATGTQLTLELKQGLNWSDGQPVTCRDIAYTLGVQKDPAVGWISAARKKNIDRWEVLSTHQMKVFFKSRNLFNLLDLNEGFIIPKHQFEKWPVSEWRRNWAQDLVGMGPYRLQTWDGAETLILQSTNPGAWPDLGFAFVREKETLFQLLKTGELDFCWTLPFERVSDFQGELKPVIYDDLTFAFIGWNPIHPEAQQDESVKEKLALNLLKKEQPHPLFGDQRVRQAMAHAIARERHLKDLWKGHSSVPATPWRAGLNYTDVAVEPLGYDPARAEQLLEEAGWLLVNGKRERNGIPFQFTIICNAGKGLREHYLLAIQEDLAKIGIQMEIDLQEGSRYISNCIQGRFDAMFGAFSTGTRPDLRALYHSGATYNFTSWTSVDHLLDQIEQASTDETLEKAITQIEARFLKDQPLLPLYKGKHIGATRLLDWNLKCNYLDPLYDIENWGP